MKPVYFAVLFLLGCSSTLSRRIRDRLGEDSSHFENNDEIEREDRERQVVANYDTDNESPIGSHGRFRRPEILNREENEDSESESENVPSHYSRRSYHHRPRRFRQDTYDNANHRRSDYYMKEDNNEVLSKVYDVLQDISSYLRDQRRYDHPQQHQMAPPQIIYVPYPIYTPPLCSCRTPSSNKSNEFSVDNRFKDPEDMRQIWGLSNVADYDNVNYKPLSFESSSKIPFSNNLAHGDSSNPTADSSSSTAERGSPSVDLPPSSCDIAMLSCCRESTKELLFKCLESRNCSTNVDCSKKHISEILLKAERFYIKN